MPVLSSQICAIYSSLPALLCHKNVQYQCQILDLKSRAFTSSIVEHRDFIGIYSNSHLFFIPVLFMRHGKDDYFNIDHILDN